MKLSLRFNTLLVFSFFLIAALGVLSCDSDDTLPARPEETSVAQLQAFSAKSGKNRVLIEGTIPANSNITEVTIYWNDKADAKSISVSSSSEEQHIATFIEDLEEGFYTFEAQTIDASGNGSVILTGGSEVYGDPYISTLFNRPVDTNYLSRNELEIVYGGMDLTTGVIGTEIMYENTDGEMETIYLPIENDQVRIENFKRNASYSYRSLFIPSPVSIDTFYTDYTSFKPEPPFPTLVNAAVPFLASSVQGRWGILQDWTTTEPVRVHAGGHGGWDEWNNNIFNIESGWGAPAITNGKIYQTVEAKPGDYALEVSVRDSNHSESDEGGSYFVVAKGMTLPDVADVTTASEVLVYERIHTTAVSNPETYRLEFSVDEISDITIGQITTQWGQTPGRFCNIFSFEIVANE